MNSTELFGFVTGALCVWMHGSASDRLDQAVSLVDDLLGAGWQVNDPLG